jgi:DNA recombination-dependent growth factor C
VRLNSLFDKICNQRHQGGLSAPPKIKSLSSARSQEIAKRKEEKLLSGRVIEKSTKKGSQREQKMETEKVKKEGRVSKMVMSEGRTAKQYC